MRSQPQLASRPLVPWTDVNDHFIDGKWHSSDGSDRLAVTDPATGSAWGSSPDGTPGDVDRAVAAAASALPEWRRARAGDRAVLMRRFADELEHRATPLSHTLSRENGSPVAETAGAAANAAGILRYFAGLAELLETDDVRPYPGDPSRETVVRRDAVGVCALIAPWNFPINLVMVKLAPALLAGCTAVVKTAPSTPLSARFVAEAASAAGVPRGVVNVLSGANATGDRLIRHPQVDKVAFTGSTPVGRHIAQVCGELLRPVTLELGGKSSAIVMPDADLAAVSSGLIASCLRNTGQTCYTATRVLAPRSRYEEVVDMATATIESAPMGDPFDPSTRFGPLATARQRDVVLELIDCALREGARPTTGARPVPGPGYFVEPTVLADVGRASRVAHEEIFGPVLTVLPYDDLDDAVALANNTSFGLGGVVFGVDTDLALSVASRMDTGSVGINGFASNHAAPFGGRGDSGLGVEYGPEGLHAYLTYQSIHRTREEHP